MLNKSQVANVNIRMTAQNTVCKKQGPHRTLGTCHQHCCVFASFRVILDYWNLHLLSLTLSPLSSDCASRILTYSMHTASTYEQCEYNCSVQTNCFNCLTGSVMTSSIWFKDAVKFTTPDIRSFINSKKLDVICYSKVLTFHSQF